MQWPPLHVGVETGHMSPHPPQLFGSVIRSTQLRSQQVWAELHMVVQSPQCISSVLMSAQTSPHAT